MYTMHADPSHAWLEVPRSEIEALGIAGDISTYSYQSLDGSTVYLEEDCDAPRFLIRKLGAAADWRAHVDERHSNDQSRIRNLPSYRPKSVVLS